MSKSTVLDKLVAEVALPLVPEYAVEVAADLGETLALCGERGVAWALDRSARSPYSVRYWLGQARARRGIGYGDDAH